MGRESFPATNKPSAALCVTSFLAHAASTQPLATYAANAPLALCPEIRLSQMLPEKDSKKFASQLKFHLNKLLSFQITLAPSRDDTAAIPVPAFYSFRNASN